MESRITLLVLTLAACGQNAKEDTIAQAFTIESKQEKAADELAEAQAAKKREEAAATKERETAITAAIDAVAQLPAEMPADLGAACDAVTAAYDEYLKSGPERDALSWSDGRRRKMGERTAACLKMGQIRVAACETVVLQAAPAELDDQPRREAARRLMERCHEKFG
jgi:hypothetical protein